MPESNLVRAMRRRLVSAGAYVEKTWGGGPEASGRPDLIGCLSGRFFGIEVKMPGKKATLLQQHVLGLISKAGGFAGVMTSVEDLDRMLSHFPYICTYCLGDLDGVGRCRYCKGGG